MKISGPPRLAGSDPQLGLLTPRNSVTPSEPEAPVQHKNLRFYMSHDRAVKELHKTDAYASRHQVHVSLRGGRIAKGGEVWSVSSIATGISFAMSGTDPYVIPVGSVHDHSSFSYYRGWSNLGLYVT